MFSLALEYRTGILVHLCLFGGLLIGWLLINLYRSAYNFVHDYSTWDWERLPGFLMLCISDNDATDYLNIAPYSIALGIAAFVWPIIWPVTVCVVAILGLRKYYRFKKRVDEALSD